MSLRSQESEPNRTSRMAAEATKIGKYVSTICVKFQIDPRSTSPVLPESVTREEFELIVQALELITEKPRLEFRDGSVYFREVPTAVHETPSGFLADFFRDAANLSGFGGRISFRASERFSGNGEADGGMYVEVLENGKVIYILRVIFEVAFSEDEPHLITKCRNWILNQPTVCAVIGVKIGYIDAKTEVPPDFDLRVFFFTRNPAAAYLPDEAPLPLVSPRVIELSPRYDQGHNDDGGISERNRRLVFSWAELFEDAGVIGTMSFDTAQIRLALSSVLGGLPQLPENLVRELTAERQVASRVGQILKSSLATAFTHQYIEKRGRLQAEKKNFELELELKLKNLELELSLTDYRSENEKLKLLFCQQFLASPQMSNVPYFLEGTASSLEGLVAVARGLLETSTRKAADVDDERAAYMATRIRCLEGIARKEQELAELPDALPDADKEAFESMTFREQLDEIREREKNCENETRNVDEVFRRMIVGIAAPWTR